MAKEFFKKNNVAYEEKDISSDDEAREEMVAKSGQLGAPVIDVDDEIIVGFDERKLSKLIGVK